MPSGIFNDSMFFLGLLPCVCAQDVKNNTARMAKRKDRITKFYGFEDVGAFPPAGTKINAAELIQYRLPVGLGPSSKTCPRCEPLLLSTTAHRTIPKLGILNQIHGIWTDRCPKARPACT